MYVTKHAGGERPQPQRDNLPARSKTEYEGYLVDLDFAAHVETDAVQRLQVVDIAHTLALPYLAIDHLHTDQSASDISSGSGTELFDHYYRHDLEGFFWSLWWILFKAMPPHPDQWRWGNEWKDNNLGANREAKERFLERPYIKASDMIASSLWPFGSDPQNHTTMRDFLRAFTRVFRDGYDALRGDPDVDKITAGGNITVEKIFAQFPEPVLRQIFTT